MTAILTSKIRIKNANLLIDMVKNSASTLLGFGRPEIWSDSTVPGVEVDPYTPVDSFDQIDRKEWQELIGAKRVTASDIVPMIRRQNWQSGAVFYSYDDQEEQILNEKPFYVLTTPDYNIYKCLDNNGNVPSTVKPTATSSTPFTTSPDGYLWKYMGTLTQDDVAKFLTTNHMPISTPAGNTSTNGAIYHIEVVNTGSGYTTAPTVTITGDGSGALATAYVSGGAITKILITNPGTGYKNATVTLTPTSGGTGGVARAVLSPIGGHGYDNQRELGGFYIGISVTVTGDEDGTFTVANDFRKIVLFSSAAMNTPTNNDVTNGVALGGRIGEIGVLDGGSGYSNSGYTGVEVYEDGQSTSGVPTATATANVANGRVTTVDIGTGGSGYTFAPVITFTGGGGSGAQGVAILSGGGISAIVVTNGGKNYTSAPTVKIGGYGATASITVVSTSITAIDVSARGRNYTTPVLNMPTGATTPASIVINKLESYRTTYAFTLNAVTNSPFDQDATIEDISTGATAIVVEHDTVNSILYVNNVTPGPTGNTFDVPGGTHNIRQEDDHTKTAQVTAVAWPELVPGEGDFLYVENREKSPRASDQAESVVIVLES